MTLALRYAARSHLGLGPKSRNEDSGYAGPHLLVLADGMGGHAAGDVASSMIVGALAHLDEDSVSGEQALRTLEDELHGANDQLREAMQSDGDLAGMGATTIAMLRSGNKLAMAHIGDSRAYLLREGTFSQITKDHSFVQQLLDEHRITDEEAQRHPQRSLVTRVMTGNPEDTPDLSMRELRLGDRYLLCSDGLSDFVSAEIIQEILAESPTADEAADRCIEVAVKASSRDNITVVVADVVDDVTEPPTAPVIVGAAAVRAKGRRRTRALPISPAEKAAALSREATGVIADEEDESILLAEQTHSPRVLWIRRVGIALVALVVLVGGGYAAYDWTQRQYFLGEQDGYVTINRGVNQQLGPLELSTLVARTDVLVSDLPSHHQDALHATIVLPGLDEARASVAQLRITAAECRAQNAAGVPCGTTTTPGPSSPATSVPTTEAGTPSGGFVITLEPGSPTALPAMSTLAAMSALPAMSTLATMSTLPAMPLGAPR